MASENPRIVFHLSYDSGQPVGITISLTGEWDDDLMEAASAFLARQIWRLKRKRQRGPLICDGWDVGSDA